MIIRLRHHDGTTQEWEWSGAPRLSEARLLKEQCGLTIRAFLEGFEQLDPECVTALLYLLHRRDGTPVAWGDIECAIEIDDPQPGVPTLEFAVAEDEDEGSDPGAQAAAKAREGKGGTASGPKPKAGSTDS